MLDHPESTTILRDPPAITSARRRRRVRSRGQSVAEFAILLPVMLAFVGLTVDFARAFQAFITLESATRDAAEAAATGSPDTGAALTLAKKTVCLQAQNIPGFQRSGQPSPNDVQACTAPAVTVVSFTRATTGTIASDKYPLATVTIHSTVDFQPLFAYPFITTNGHWTISAQASYTIQQNRT